MTELVTDAIQTCVSWPCMCEPLAMVCQLWCCAYLYAALGSLFFIAYPKTALDHIFHVSVLLACRDQEWANSSTQTLVSFWL